jgi:hypothetical protein
VSELDRADALAPDSLRAATVAMTRAELLGAWGFPRESYRELTRASRLSPLDAKATSEAAWLEAMFKDPTQAIPPPPGSEAMPRR